MKRIYSVVFCLMKLLLAVRKGRHRTGVWNW